MNFEINPSSSNGSSVENSPVPVSSEKEGKREIPQFSRFEEIEEYFGSIEKGGYIRNGNENLRIVNRVDSERLPGGGIIDLMRPNGDRMKFSFGEILARQRDIQGVGGFEESEPVKEKVGSKKSLPVNVAVSDKEPDFVPDIKDETKIELSENGIDSSTVPVKAPLESTEQSDEVWAEAYVNDHIGEEEKKSEDFKHFDQAREALYSIKQHGHEINQDIKTALSREIAKDSKLQNSELLQGYLGMMEKELDYAHSVEKDQKVSGMLKRLELRSQMAGIRKEIEKSNTFQDMVMDMKFSVSLFSKKPWQEIIDLRTQAISVIKSAAEKETKPSRKSFYQELVREYEKLNKKDQEWCNRETVIDRIGKGSRWLLDKAKSATGVEPVKKDSEAPKKDAGNKGKQYQLTKEYTSDARHDFARGLLADAEEVSTPKKRVVQLPEKKKWFRRQKK